MIQNLHDYFTNGTCPLLDPKGSRCDMLLDPWSPECNFTLIRDKGWSNEDNLLKRFPLHLSATRILVDNKRALFMKELIDVAKISKKRALHIMSLFGMRGYTPEPYYGAIKKLQEEHVYVSKGCDFNYLGRYLYHGYDILLPRCFALRVRNKKLLEPDIEDRIQRFLYPQELFHAFQ